MKLRHLKTKYDIDLLPCIARSFFDDVHIHSGQDLFHTIFVTVAACLQKICIIIRLAVANGVHICPFDGTFCVLYPWLDPLPNQVQDCEGRGLDF